MTLLEEIRESYREGSTPVLETERLVLRAPRFEDAKAVVTLANDRRVAENTARIPHPYRQADADEWITGVTAGACKETFLITLDGAPIGACGLDMRDAPTPELGYWLCAPYWGHRFCHRGRACGHRLCVRASRARRAAGRCARQQSGVAPGAGEMRLPVDRRRALPHPRHELVGAVRSLSP